MDLDPRFLTTEYVVEATDAEKFFLWQLNRDKVEWEQGTSGTIIHIGYNGGVMQAKRPINISCYWDRINGMNVLFWYACSQLVDHKMIDDWFDANAYYVEAKSGRAARCDAMNFNHCISYSKEERPPVKKGLVVPPHTYYKKWKG